MEFFERGIVVVLLIMMMLAILVATIDLGWTLVVELLKPPLFLLDVEEVSQIFGFVFMILIGLELLETIKTYLSREQLHVEVVFLVAMIAIARKVILLEVKKLDALVLLGIAAIILALAVGYYFVKLAHRPDKPTRKDAAGAPSGEP
jgi:uncharacterized membrane protein (DUF373 family)